MRPRIELLQFAPQSQRTAALFAGLTRTASRAGIEIQASRTYHGDADWLMLWGPGAPDRFEPMRQQLAGGGHVVAFDLAYWQRDVKVRVSIDAAHPQQWILKTEWPESRLLADRVPLEDSWSPKGPVIVAGIGAKARAQYGARVASWEREQIAEAQRRGYPVQYRPKRASDAGPTGVAKAPILPIERALRGAALVVTWHSNVAVDAIRLGIPVICQDGAAAAVCSPAFPVTGAPLPLASALRERFLGNLAWFQWAPMEAGIWPFLGELLR